jgi:hypothetical protein
MIGQRCLFVFGAIRARIIQPTEETLLDAARYQLRVAMCRTTATTPGAMSGIPEFGLILAHVREVVNFPFEIPDPLAHPDDVGAAWDHFLDSDPELWDCLIGAIGVPFNVASTYLPLALEEVQALVRHGAMPPSRRWTEQPRSR